ncbi:AAA family ATPase [Bacillus licheniformis]|nr:AAA family ATPase [Bacillus licheniformis]
MNIHAIHIYGYGKFANQTFRLSPSNLHLIYGLNEAGKRRSCRLLKACCSVSEDETVRAETGVITGDA